MNCNHLKYTDTWVNNLKYYPDTFFKSKYKFTKALKLSLGKEADYLKRRNPKQDANLYLIENKKTKKKKILKILSVTKTTSISQILNEIYITCTLGQQFDISPKVTLFGLTNSIDPQKKISFNNNLFAFLIMDYLDEYISLSEYLSILKNKSLIETKSILFKLVHLLYILHTKTMFKHNDIHPGNIMIDTKRRKQIVKFNKNKYLLDSPDIKIIDFGESTFNKKKNKKKISLKSATMLKNIVKTNVLLINKIYKYKNENADKHFVYTISLLLLSKFKNIKVPKLTSYKSFLKNNLFDDLKLKPKTRKKRRKHKKRAHTRKKRANLIN
jgi:hypothetical protein